MKTRDIIFFPNVRRQESLAGRKGGSQTQGVKALGMLSWQHPLCLNGNRRELSIESWIGQRLPARPCSQYISWVHRVRFRNSRGAIILTTKTHDQKARNPIQ